MPVDLKQTTPTLLPDQLRTLAAEAETLSADPVNVLDDNPHIAHEWMIVAGEFRAAAARMENRFNMLFPTYGVSLGWAAFAFFIASLLVSGGVLR